MKKIIRGGFGAISAFTSVNKASPDDKLIYYKPSE